MCLCMYVHTYTQQSYIEFITCYAEPSRKGYHTFFPITRDLGLGYRHRHRLVGAPQLLRHETYIVLITSIHTVVSHTWTVLRHSVYSTMDSCMVHLWQQDITVLYSYTPPTHKDPDGL